MAGVFVVEAQSAHTASVCKFTVILTTSQIVVVVGYCTEYWLRDSPLRGKKVAKISDLIFLTGNPQMWANCGQISKVLADRSPLRPAKFDRNRCKLWCSGSSLQGKKPKQVILILAVNTLSYKIASLRRGQMLDNV